MQKIEDIRKKKLYICLNFNLSCKIYRSLRDHCERYVQRSPPEDRLARIRCRSQGAAMRPHLLLLSPCLLSACVASPASPPPVQVPEQPEEYVLRSAFIRENAEVAFKVKERGFSSLAACDKRRLELDPREIALTCVAAEEANG